MDANNTDSDQTAWEQSDLGPYCLQYRLPKIIGRQEEQTKKVLNGGLKIKLGHSKFRLKDLS